MFYFGVFYLFNIFIYLFRFCIFCFSINRSIALKLRNCLFEISWNSIKKVVTVCGKSLINFHLSVTSELKKKNYKEIFTIYVIVDFFILCHCAKRKIFYALPTKCSYKLHKYIYKLERYLIIDKIICIYYYFLIKKKSIYKSENKVEYKLGWILVSVETLLLHRIQESLFLPHRSLFDISWQYCWTQSKEVSKFIFRFALEKVEFKGRTLYSFMFPAKDSFSRKFFFFLNAFC